jgi:transposase
VAAPRTLGDETRARAVRMYQDRIRDLGQSKPAARHAAGAMLDTNPATLRTPG